MALPHYTQQRAAQNKEEPVYLNLFEVHFQMPPAINGGEILHQYCKNVTLPTHPTIETAEQKYKYSTRSYATFPSETSVEFDVTFNVNLNENNSPYTFKTITDLYKLIYNPSTGETSLKTDYVATITVDVHNKIGEIIRRVIYKDSIITDVSDMDLDWENGSELFEFNSTFKCDHWDDLVVE